MFWENSFVSIFLGICWTKCDPFPVGLIHHCKNTIEKQKKKIPLNKSTARSFLKRIGSDRNLTLQTICTYEQHLQNNYHGTTKFPIVDFYKTHKTYNLLCKQKVWLFHIKVLTCKLCASFPVHFRNT